MSQQANPNQSHRGVNSNFQEQTRKIKVSFTITNVVLYA